MTKLALKKHKITSPEQYVFGSENKKDCASNDKSSSEDLEAIQFKKMLRYAAHQDMPHPKRKVLPSPQETPKNVFSKYIKKTLLPLDQPITYTVNPDVEAYAKKKEKCKEKKIKLNKKIIHDDYNEFPSEVKAALVNSLILPEREQMRRAEKPNPVEINQRFDKFSTSQLEDDRTNPISNYNHGLEESDAYDVHDIDLTKNILSSSKVNQSQLYVEKGKRTVWNNQNNPGIVLDANGNYAERKKRVCPCDETKDGWKPKRKYRKQGNGACIMCDDEKKTKDLLHGYANKIMEVPRKLKQNKKNKPEERRLKELKAKFRKNRPI